jgi:hypothetical protein
LRNYGKYVVKIIVVDPLKVNFQDLWEETEEKHYNVNKESRSPPGIRTRIPSNLNQTPYCCANFLLGLLHELAEEICLFSACVREAEARVTYVIIGRAQHPWN